MGPRRADLVQPIDPFGMRDYAMSIGNVERKLMLILQWKRLKHGDIHR